MYDNKEEEDDEDGKSLFYNLFVFHLFFPVLCEFLLVCAKFW